MDKIETNRLILRPFRDEDAPGMFAYLSHPRVNCFLDDQISTLEEAVAKVQKEKQITLIWRFV